MSLMPDVWQLTLDPELGAQRFTYTRNAGTWVGGRMVLGTGSKITATGIIQAPTPEMLVFFPEGERREGQIVVYTPTTLRLSEGKDVSDIITWRGEDYRVVRVDRWDDYGYNVAYAQKM